MMRTRFADPHQGQQSTRTAPTGRTHDCKRPLRCTPNDLLPGGGHPHMKGCSSLLPAGADRHLPGGAVRWFDARRLRPARPDSAKDMDDRAERHTPRSASKLKKAKQLSGTASASNKSRFMAKCACLWLRRPTEF